METISNRDFFSSYNSGFDDIKNKNSNATKFIGYLKIASYFTVVIPLIIGSAFIIDKYVIEKMSKRKYTAEPVNSSGNKTNLVSVPEIHQDREFKVESGQEPKINLKELSEDDEFATVRGNVDGRFNELTESLDAKFKVMGEQVDGKFRSVAQKLDEELRMKTESLDKLQETRTSDEIPEEEPVPDLPKSPFMQKFDYFASSIIYSMNNVLNARIEDVLDQMKDLTFEDDGQKQNLLENFHTELQNFAKNTPLSEVKFIEAKKSFFPFLQKDNSTFKIINKSNPSLSITISNRRSSAGEFRGKLLREKINNKIESMSEQERKNVNLYDCILEIIKNKSNSPFYLYLHPMLYKLNEFYKENHSKHLSNQEGKNLKGNIAAFFDEFTNEILKLMKEEKEKGYKDLDNENATDMERVGKIFEKRYFEKFPPEENEFVNV